MRCRAVCEPQRHMLSLVGKNVPELHLSPAKALAREKVRGLWLAIPTPFTPSGLLDEDVLSAAVDYYIEGLGVDGIFCGGVMGEFWALTVDERQRVQELVAEGAAARIPVMAHTGHHVLAEAVALCEHAREVGIDFAIVMNPYYPPRPSDAIVRKWYRDLTSETSIPLFLFNTKYSGYALSPELISELSDLESVCGIKNPRGREHLLEVQRLAGDRIIVADASEGEWLDLHLNHGLQALMSTPALALFQTPGSRPIAEYTALADSGDIDTAWELQRSLAGHRRVFDRWMRDPWLARGEGVVPIAYLKAWLGMMGLPHGPVRSPLVPLTGQEENELRRDLERLELLGAVERPVGREKH